MGFELQPVVVGLQEKGSTIGEEIVGSEAVWEEVGERGELVGVVGGYEELDVLGVAELLEELAAVAAGGGGDGEGGEGGLAVEGEVGYEELFGVDGVVEGEAGEFEVDADVDPTRGSDSDGGDPEVGDWWAGEGAGGVDEGREELGEGGGGLGRGLGLGGFDYETGSIHILWSWKRKGMEGKGRGRKREFFINSQKP